MKINTQPTLNKKQLRKGFTLVELLVVIAIIASLAGLSYGPIMNHLESSKRTEAISNGKMIHTGLMGFMVQNDNAFPNADTGDATSAEECLQQLMDGGFVGDEKYFWNRNNGKAGICSISRPDNNGTLENTENAWGYTMNLDPGSDGIVPVLFDSCKSAASTGTFSTLPWKGKAVIVRVDGSCVAMDIDYGDGKPLNDDGTEKEGPVVESRGGADDADIFNVVPGYAESFATSS